jgi:dCMP deaminase
MKVDWDIRFLELSDYISEWSKDDKRKVGVVIVDDQKRVVSLGYNGFPSGLNDDLVYRHKDPVKLLFTEHAERNAIYSAAKNGVSLKDCTIYTSFFPCADCARAIVQSGIKRVVSYKYNLPKDSKWNKHFEVSNEILKELKIEVSLIDKKFVK